jgi:hypothetical protein
MRLMVQHTSLLLLLALFLALIVGKLYVPPWFTPVPTAYLGWWMNSATVAYLRSYFDDAHNMYGFGTRHFLS